MYELQMMGVMEDAMTDISIPHLVEYNSASKCYSNKGIKSQIQDANGHSSGLVSNQLNRAREIGTERLAQKEALSVATKSSIGQRGYNWMDEYDSMVFCHPKTTPVKQNGVKRNNGKADMLNHLRNPDREEFSLETLAALRSPGRTRNYSSERKSSLDLTTKGGTLTQRVGQKKGNTISTISKAPSSQHTRVSRQLNFGPRGFAAALKASASTEISAEHAKSGTSSGRANKTRPTSKNPNGVLLRTNTSPLVHRESDLSSKASSHSRQDAVSVFDDGSQIISSPVSIKTIAAVRMRDHGRQIRGDSGSRSNHDSGAGSEATQEKLTSSSDLDTSIGAHDSKVALSPGSSMAPWLTILNPSNPRKMNITLASRLGRWQHIFPRPVRASKIKWKSLCSPAAVPLTTEDFPTYAQITAEYEETTYNVSPLQEEDVSETNRSPDWLLRELVAFRFTQGFQVVVGPRIEQSMNLPSQQTVDIFEDSILSTSGSTIFMSRGNLIHQLSYIEGGGTAVRCLTRRTTSHSHSEYFDDSPNLYKPIIRTMHAQVYSTQSIDISPERQEPLWETIDSFIADHQQFQREPKFGKVRSWRARFVLIPVDPPSSGRQALQPINEDNEEEVRLEGIRKLTQIWQRFRYVPPSSRRFQASEHNRIDTNPLDIIYRTQNPSTVIEAELESINGSETIGKPLQLLPDSELFQRSNLDMVSLAQVMQSEKGVRMMDRRWHWRLHYKCFVGFEFTTWLLDNFRDIETRDEAVDLGNELMRSGLFKHVERRHQFRDGNFFYQIASEYQTLSRSWLGRPDVSVTSTALSESASQELSNLSGSHESSSGTAQEDSATSTGLARKPRLEVVLSKALLCDVDIRKRSHRPEVVTLHYDRLHNPDNCYHILLEWMNCTAKLIEDAVVSWATTVERYGLRLVELPLGEASAITKLHPFRAPTLVGLAVRPPGEQPPSLCNTTSLGSSAKFESHPYQKAILKKFQFVLDFEAATDFPSDVDVTYSWGRPSYKYPQYIHRSGVTLAQITDDGQFLLLANRLYNERSTANQENEKPQHTDFPQASSRHSPVRGSNHPGSTGNSPHPSPSVRATQDGTSHSGKYPRLAPPTASITPEQILEEFEIFCQDEAALIQFYHQVLSKTLSPGGNTPFWEASIPTLGLPPSLALGEASVSDGATGKI
jgi:hypothetical protein